MKLVSASASATMALALLGACNGDPTTGPGQSFEWDGQVAAEDEIEIKGVNGGIQVFLATGTQVEVRAVKRGDQSDPSSVTIDVVQHANGVTICAVYPDVPGQPPNECLPGLLGSMNVQDNDVEVTFTVNVPSGVDFRGVTVNGAIVGTGLQSNAFATTVNGDIDLTTTELATGTTVNGSVGASIGLATWDRDLTFTTVNGSANVEIPAGTNAEVRLSTVNGAIATDFFLPEVSPNVLQGTLGAGGRMLTVSAVNGSVVLRSG